MNCLCSCHRLVRMGLLLMGVDLVLARLSCRAWVSALLRATPGALVWHPKLPPSSLHQHHQMAAHLQPRALDLVLTKVALAARGPGRAGPFAGLQSHRVDTYRLLAD